MKVKIHAQGAERVLAAADSDLIGKTLEDGEIVFNVSPHFYDGKVVDAKKLGRLLSEHSNINLVGEQTVGVAIEKKLVTPQDVRKINGVPHVQIFSF